MFFLIVTALLLFLQPPAIAQTLEDRSSAVPVVPALPEFLVGPTYRDDLLIKGYGEPVLLLVITPELPEELKAEARALAESPAGSRLAILFTAPRHDPADAGRIAAALEEISGIVPRVLIGTGPDREWTVSVPGDVAPLWLVRIITTLPGTRINEAQLNAARLGYGRRNPPLEVLFSQSIPAAHLSVAQPGDLNQVITPLLRTLEARSEHPRAMDRNYLLIPWQLPWGPPEERALIVSEFGLVLALVVLTVVLLLYTILLPRRVHHYLRSMARNMPAILITLLAITASLIAANLMLRLVGRIPRISPSPLLLAGGKIAFGSLVLSVLAALLGHRIRRATAVYSGAAVLFLLVGAIVSSAVSIILGAYFTVSFVVGVIFSLGRNAWIKGAALLLSLVPIVYLVLALAPAADAQMARALLTPSLGRELVTAIMLLPVLLMFFRLDSIAVNTPLLPFFAMIATVGLALTVASLIVQVRNPLPQEILVTERYPADPSMLLDRIPDTGERLVAVAGGGTAGEVRILLNGESALLCPELPCLRGLAAPQPPFTLSVERSQLLDRYTITWSVVYREDAETVKLVLETDAPVQLYATDTPTEQPTGSRGSRFTFITGPYPPETISGTMVLRSDMRGNRVSLGATSRFPGEASTPDQSFYATHLGRTWTIRETVRLE